jgi:anti-sigma factor RsiW
VDEVKLQSYFDGELPLEQLESITSHLASCVTCATAARELEEESALVMNALAAEFEASVPTERLRQRIDGRQPKPVDSSPVCSISGLSERWVMRVWQLCWRSERSLPS